MCGSDRKTFVSGVLAALAAVSLQCAAGEIGRLECSAASIEPRASSWVQIESVTHVAATADVPAHCAVAGFVDHGTHVGFSLALPDAWNRKFLFLGVGGFAGVLQPLQRGIVKGYVTATTDTGHKGASLEDATWALNNPAGIVNHYETSVEVVTHAVKDLTAIYYGAMPERSYFEGCSAGGRQGLIEAQRFPATFDGIIAAAPAWNYSKLLVSFIENGNEILKSPDNWIPPDTFAAIDRAVLQQCDALDGVQDGIVTDPRRCKPDLKALLCKGGTKAASCLTGAQIQTIGKLVAPEFAKDRPGYFGFYLTGSDASGGYSWGWPEWFFGTVPLQRDAVGTLNFARNVLPEGAQRGNGPNQFVLGQQFFRYMVLNDPGFDARTFDIRTDAAKLESRMGELLDADDTNLDRFVRSGGKLLIWHGWSDPAIPPDMAIDLYERIRRDTRGSIGQPPIEESARLFMVPGVQHCGGGTGLIAFDPLPALEEWVEHGKAPDRIVAAQVVEGKSTRSRPLCPYPKIARFRGVGNPEAADSFDCK
jgi:feruloyl esterase